MASVDLSTSPWLIRVIDRIPLPLFATGMLFALAYFLFVTMLALVLWPWLGEEPGRQAGPLRIAPRRPAAPHHRLIQ